MRYKAYCFAERSCLEPFDLFVLRLSLMFLHRSLRCFEIVFIFLRQVQQLIFLILFGLSYNYENWHSNQHIYFRKPVTIATI